MNDYIINLLKENGYEYLHGSIVDAEGNFVPSVTLGSEIINSQTDEKTYKALLDNDKELENKESFIDTFKKFEEDPINNPLPAEAEEQFPIYQDYKLQNYDPIHQETAEEFAKDKESEAIEKDGDIHYQAIELFRHLQEQGHEDITDDYINEFKKNEALIRKFEEEDPSTNVKINRIDDTDERLANNATLNPENISIYLEKAAVSVMKGFNDLVFGKAHGMEGTKEEKQAYKDALEKRKAMKEPAVKIVREDNRKKREELESVWNQLSTAEKWDPTNKQNSLIGYALRELDKDETRLTDYLEGSNFYNPLNEHFITKAATFGMRDAYDSYFYLNYLHKKINSGEELTENEQLAAEALAGVTQSHSLGIEQKFLHEASEGAAESGVFVLGMFPGGFVSKGVAATVTRGVGKKLATRGAKRAVVKGAAKDLAPEVIAQNTAKAISRGETAGKVMGESVSLLGTTVIHPMSHVERLNRYNGSIHFFENDDGSVRVSTDRKTYGIMLEELEANKRMVEGLIDVERDAEKVSFLMGEVAKIDEAIDSLEVPKSMGESTMYGLFETFKEVTIEKVGGPLLTRGAGAVASKYANKSWVKSVRQSKVAENFNKANNSFMNVKNKYNNIIEGVTGTPTFGNRLIGNNLEEIAEEFTQQLLPAWGESDAEKADRRAELMSGMFYAQVSVQTLIMNMAMKAGAAPFQAPSYLKEYNKNKDARKAFKSMIKEFEKGGVDATRAEELLMSIGEGKQSVQEYNNKINKLRENGNHEAANSLEKDKYFSIAKEMIGLGKGRDFIRSMNRAIIKGDVTGESVAVVQDVLNEVRALDRDMEAHGNLRNRNYVLELKSRERYIEKQKAELEKARLKLQTEEASPQRDGTIDGISEAMTNLEKASKQVQKEIQHETSTKMKDKLQKEAEVSRDLLSNYKMFRKDGQDHKTSIEYAHKTVKGKYGILMSSGTLREAGKTLDNYVKMEMFNESLKEVEKMPAEVFKNVKEGSVRSQTVQKHIEDIGPDVDAVTEFIDESDSERIQALHDRIDKLSGELDELEATSNPMGAEGGPSADVVSPIIPKDNVEGDPDNAAQNTFDEDYFDPDEIDNFFDDLLPTASPDALERLKQAVRDVVDMLEKETGERPSFRDYIDELLATRKIPRDNVKDHMRALALAWNSLGYEKSDWKNVHKDLFESPQAYLDALDAMETEEIIQTPEEEQKNKESQEVSANKKSTVTPVQFIPNSGKPKHVTPNSGKTFGTELFLHYSGVEFTQTITKDGDKTVYVKIKSAIPQMREHDYYDIKSLVHPNKNNIGDRLQVRILENNDLADMPVAVRGKYGVQTGTIPFEQWVNENIPEGMSLEEFQQTDKYIGKVPIALIDSEGNPVAPVTEVDWYNEVSVGDKSLEFDDVDLDNLTDSHKEDIAENREQALELRRAMLDGRVPEVEILDNLTFPPLQEIDNYDANGEIIPTKTLNEVAPDSKIVMMTASGNLVDLDKRTMGNTEDIINMGDSEGGLLERRMVERDGVMVPLPINMNRAFYLTHFTTVNGVKKYIALDVLRKNESHGNSANETDVQTARWIAAINNIVRFGDSPDGSQILRDKNHPLYMSKEQAEDLRQQILAITGIDVKTKYTALVEGMIAHQAPEKDGKRGAKTTHASELVDKLRNYNKGTGEFLTPVSEFVQNTFLTEKNNNLKNVPMIQIKKEADGSFTVEKVPITPFFENGVEVKESRGYEDYLKERLSTNVMGYNVGTETNPVFTIAPQQKIKFKPIEVEVDSPEKVLTEKIEEQKKEKEVIKKVKEVDEKEVSSDSKAIEAKKADIERRRQEELGSRESRKFTLDDGNINEVIITEEKERKVVRVIKHDSEGNLIGQYESVYKKELSNEVIYEMENPSGYEYSKTEQLVVEGKRADATNAKYDAEIAALEGTTTQVQDLSGNTYSVNESDITTYETESGTIRYITNENGDMVMLSDKNTVKEGVSEVFNENPELANEVYEALGFKQKSKERNTAFTETISNIENAKIGEKISLHKIFPHIAEAFVTKTKDNKYYVEHTEDLFTKQQFEDYLLDRFKPTEKETDVRYLGITSQQKQQAQQLYSQYLETIFPDSQEDRILVHASHTTNIEKFEKRPNKNFLGFAQLGKGVYLSNLFNLDYWRHELELENGEGKNYYVKVNLQNTLGVNNFLTKEREESLSENIDAVYENRKPHEKENNWRPGEYAVRNPEQIHILGSKQDVEGFKEFVNNAKPITELTQEQKRKRAVAMENAAALAKELNLDLKDIDDADYLVVAELATTEEVEASISIIEGLTIKQEEDIIKWVLSKLSSRDTTIAEARQEISKEITLRIEKLNEAISNLKQFEGNPVVDNMAENLTEARTQLENTFDATDKLVAEAALRAKNVSFITDDFNENEFELDEKDYSKSNAETKPIDKVGTALKRIFAQVKNGEKGFMGLDSFTSFKQMYDTVSLALSSDIGLEADFNTMMDLLSKRQESTPWMKSLIEALKESDDQVKNQFVYNAYKQKVNAKFATLAFDNKKGIVSSIYASNSNEAQRAVVDSWRENFKRSKINKNGVINTRELQKAVDEWNSWAHTGPTNQSDKVYQKWLGRFGIQLSDRTWKALRDGELNVSEAGGRLRPAKFTELFDGMTSETSKNRPGFLFANLLKFASMNRNEKDASKLEFLDQKNNHPFTDMGTILKQLSELEAKYNPTYASTSRYVNSKIVTEIESYNYFYEQFKKLKESALGDKKYLKDMEKLSFSEDSYLLKMLIEDDVFAHQFDHGMMDLMALKELYKKSPMNAGIEDLSSFDYMFAQRASFQDRDQGSPKTVEGIPFEVRMAHMNTLTNSDKGRMMLLKTGVLDLYSQSERAFEIDKEGNITFTEDLRSFMYSQMALPEIKRMVKFIQTVKKTNIDGYDGGAVRFNILPGMNAILNSEGKNVSEFISENITMDSTVLLQTIQEQFGTEINDFLQENILTEALNNVKSLAEFEVKEVDTFNNANYLKNRTGPISENMKIAELDFIINSMLTNMSYMQLMAGDPAMYYNSDANPVSGKDAVMETKISQKLAINLGKRMAAMIAPGSVLADSKNNQYVQIFIEDIYGVAENILDIVGWHYTKAEIDAKGANGLTYREMLLELKNGNDEYTNELKTRFSRIAEFIGIESTDAQEYSTLEEHLYIMEKQGRLNKKQLKEIRRSINKGQDLTTELLDLVLQPIKPVYTGTIYDSKQDVNRMMYIKSSSFPLIPQLTKGRNLDALRVQMEGIEKVYGKTVRASYNSANKVGGLTSEHNVKSFGQAITGDNLLILPREHFKIQQDVPNHSAKVQEDRVSLGTQMFKLLMGDGIMDITKSKFIVNKEEFTGKELKTKFEQVFKGMIDINRDRFLESLGLDENMNPINKTETIEKLEKMLKKEAKSRGFSKQDLKTLSLVDDGKGGKTFKIPLWLSGNSNKYESMLNALINNRIFKQKIPGVKFVAGSEAGFQVKENREGLDKSRVIHIGKYKGGVLESVKNSDGKITSAQVLAPSRFKVNGVLVDMFEDFDGQDGTYVQLVNGELKIKEHMLSPELLEQFTFRIPTSSHGLGARIEIVGFLPPESGDLIITPKSFVAQMGQDFDIDSLTTYQLNHLVMDDGSIRELTEENRDQYVVEQMRKLDALEFELKKNGLAEILPNLDPLSEEIKDVKEDFREFMEILINEGATTEIEAKELISQMKRNINQDFDYKLLQNEFIKIHNAVYANPETQKHINKVLSMSYAEQQADDIESLQATSGNSFNILSPDYQMMKLNAGSTGQDAIKIYAKGVTLHSLVQQAVSEGNYIGLSRTLTDPVTNEKTVVKKGVQIGNVVSQGQLGETFGLVPEGSVFKKIARRISTIMDERTNTGTDNEKAQILGRTGLNHTDAISVDNLLSLLGFDSEFTQIAEKDYIEGAPFHRETVIDGKKVFYKERSIPYLLHSQPIIKEYFELLNSKRSVITPFSGKPQQEAIQQLLKKYADSNIGTPVFKDGKFGYLVISGDGTEVFESKQRNSSFTADMLERQVILGENSNKVSQLQVLALYTDLIYDAKNVKEMMGHVDLNNLGKSMWESTTKAEDFREFFLNEEESGIMGAKSLVGDFHFEYEIGQPLEKTNIEEVDKTEIELRDGVQNIYSENSELSEIGTVEEYQTYLETIFPDSQIKGVLFHGSPNTFEKFDKTSEDIKSGTLADAGHYFFSTSEEVGKGYLEKTTQRGTAYKGTEKVYSVIVDSKNPKTIDFENSSWKGTYYDVTDLRSGEITRHAFKRTAEEMVSKDLDRYTITEGKTHEFSTDDFSVEAEKEGYDSAIMENVNEIGEIANTVSVFSPEQIHILGNKTDIEGFKEFKENQQDPVLETKGLINLGDGVFMRPRTNQGAMVGTALSLSEALFKDIFPAKNRYINSVMKSVMQDSNIDEGNSFSVIRAKEQIFQEIKKYLTASEGLGLFNKPAGQVRRELFIDDIDNGHESLSNYIGSLMIGESTEFEEGLSKVKGNLFLNHLRYKVGEGGKPSTITFNNQESFEANQEAIYSSFKELLVEDLPLPGIRRNGITEGYSTRILAQELVAYSYASGGIVQGAVEFHKYLPIEYLDDMVMPNRNGKVLSASERLRGYNRFTNSSGVSSILYMFKRQYFQNNPESVEQFPMKEVVMEDGNSFFYSTDEKAGNYVVERVRTRSKLKQDRWRLFERLENDKTYYREIAILGETGMAEYEFGKDELTSNLGKWKPNPKRLDNLGLQTMEYGDLGTIPANNSKHVDFLDAIVAGEYGDYSYMRDIAEHLLEFIPEESTFEYRTGPFRGKFTEKNGLYLNPENAKTREELALTFLHEVVHSVSSPYINKFLSREIDDYGQLISEGAPSELISLQKVLDAYRTQLRNQDVEKYDDFQNRWKQLQKEQREKSPITVKITEAEIQVYYPTLNLKEFMATALSNNAEFLEVAGKMPYYSTGGSIFRKFGSLITSLIKRIGKGKNIQENSVALEAINRSFHAIETIHQKGIDAKKQIKKDGVEGDPDIDATSFKEAAQRSKALDNQGDPDGPIDNQGDPDLDNTDSSSMKDLLPQMMITKNTCK